MKVALTHIGDGVEVYGHSGARYKAAPGETVEFLPLDAEGLIDHPEWIPAEVDEEGDTQ